MNEAGMIYKNEKESREVRVMRGEDGGGGRKVIKEDANKREKEEEEEKREQTGEIRERTSEKVTEVGGG